MNMWIITLALVVPIFLSSNIEGKSNKCPKISFIPFPNGRFQISLRTATLDRPLPFKTRIRFYCNNNFKLVGARVIVCLRGGKWSRDAPTCVAKGCGNPGKIRNGRMLGNSRRKVGDFMRIFCDFGYELRGKDTIECQADGKWSKKPKCQKPDPLRDLKSAAKTLKEDFVDKLGLITTDSKGRSGLSGGAAGLDLVFVLDNSRSVGKENFGKGKEFVKKMIESFGVSRHELGTRIAVVPFDEEAIVALGLDDESLNSTQATTNKLDAEVQYQGGGTHTKNALLKVVNDVVPTNRPFSKKALFLITDGRSNRDQDPGDMAQLLREQNEYEIFAIGITAGADRDELLTVASEPFRSHVFMLKNFDDLTLLAQLINGSKTDYSECGIAGDTQSRLNATVGRIVGGINARPGAWPWQALIMVNSNFRCSGTLLDERWVVTAAHCFHHDQPVAEDLDVFLGEHDRNREEGSEQIEYVSKIIIHPKNKRFGLDYDIALLKLESPLKLTAYVRPVCLPGSHDSGLTLPRSPGTITGWGAIKKVGLDQIAGPSVVILQQAQIPFVQQDDCEKSSSKELPVTENMICAGSGEGSIDACKGDSGGPLVARRASDEWVLIGVVSWGEGCAVEGKYGVYTHVLKFVDWIAITMVTES